MEERITLQRLRQDCRTGLLSCIWLLFTVLGLGLMGSAFIGLVREPTSGSITGFILVTLFFGIPFGLLGLRALVRTVRKAVLLRRGEFWIYVDRIGGKRKLNNGMELGERRQYQLRLEDYSGVTGRNVTAKNDSQFQQVKKGDPCILAFVKGSKRPFAVYPGSGFVLDGQLREKTVEKICDILH